MYCVGGGFTQNLTTGAGTYPKCQDLHYQGTVLTRSNINEDDAIKIAINGSDMEYCPDQLGRKSNSAAFPGTYGYLDYFSPECHYKAGTDYLSSFVTKIEVKEIDWSGDFGKWTWEIWYR
ncbi:MAG: hypothetical protein UW27_C0006G0001 [Parcubacteria group bacterium GW2011_GWA1_44_13]|nr:MAG: hypothetical protein UW27_C0006G0001 [Parcubacteria group bacterium GW2011_GWA1_44_13]